ncbi:MAG: hypothetical protein JWN22_2963 [Nocardioides sp.]|nr:hypothetical protein [Nocardioides sp.]
MKTRVSPKALLLVLLLVVVINLPLAHSRFTSWRVERSGTDVTAAVTAHRVLSPKDNPAYFVEFAYPPAIDEDKLRWTAEVDRATYDRAVADKEIAVRVLPDRPAAYTVHGQVTHRLGLVITLIADVALLVMVLLLWRYRAKLRPRLEAVAVGDVERCKPGASLEKTDDGLYLISGEVSGITDDEIILELGDRQVRVLLDGHANPVGHQQPARVRARLVG